jgi:hypothetical protein
LSKEDFVERATIEGRPFKHLLQRASRLTAEQVRKQVDDRLTYELLDDEPDRHRGEPYAAGRGVVVEIAQAELSPEYNFPAGWTVLPGVFVNTAKEIFAVRFICPPGSTLFERLKGGIDTDALPMIQLSGLFFKLYARRTHDIKEPPWVAPLLVCPEPEFPANVEPRHVLSEIREAGFAHLLPSERIEAPRTEERLVFEVAQDESKRPAASDVVQPMLLFEGDKCPLATADILESAVQDFIKRQPRDALMPAAVVLAHGLKEDAPLFNGLRAKFRKLGVSRICIKTDFALPGAPSNSPPGANAPQSKGN